MNASARRRLTDADAFRRVIVKTGAELILHGHIHKTIQASIPGPHGPIPVVGVRASSAIGRRSQRRSQYHLYRIERQREANGRPRFGILLTTREYSSQDANFHHLSEQLL